MSGHCLRQRWLGCAQAMLMVQWHGWRWGWASALFGELVWIWPFRQGIGRDVNHGG